MFRVKEVLKEKGTTATALADKLGVSNNTITRIANSTAKPSIDLLDRIASELDVDIRELFKPSKGGEMLNGFVQHKDKVYTINSQNDLQRLLNLLESS
ncbi:helix-turn-helix transcriptional regulator [Muricauda sp. 2012CJ35-5]|uniref:Helix-turn-helix transcriptional regulator n=1 Tax=Flagellimonas spongiicola TaxID=2942208 RepID=A0ABT0PMD1_9FLAO|nr:helix-turn-helix transcriptional regulator [Allomuricauda spongiicola]MCL6272545.1 helix-turn-helix transcriptional regulator [Allomuricauda spongiicola]